MIKVTYEFDDSLIPAQCVAELEGVDDEFVVYNNDSLAGAYVRTDDIVINGMGKITRVATRQAPEILVELTGIESFKDEQFMALVAKGNTFRMMIGLAVAGTFIEANLAVENISD